MNYNSEILNNTEINFVHLITNMRLKAPTFDNSLHLWHEIRREYKQRNPY